MLNNYFINVSHNEALLENFQSLYQQKSNVSLSLEYLKQGHPILFIRKGKIIGGYILNTKAPYRYLSIFDEQQKEILLKSHLLKEEELIEITCNWMNSKISTTDWIRYYLFMFIHTMYLAISLNKKKIIAGSILPQIQLFQREVFTKIIYSSFLEKTFKGMSMIYYSSVLVFSYKMLFVVFKRAIQKRVFH